MTTCLPAFASRSFHARTLRVERIDRIEVTVDLDFGVTARRKFIIAGVEFDESWEAWEEDCRAAAMHCLIVLLGGKRLIVQPDSRSRDRWGYMREIPARVFLAERVLGRPIGYTENLPESHGPVVELTPYILWLGSEGFDVDLVKETMNGTN